MWGGGVGAALLGLSLLSPVWVQAQELSARAYLNPGSSVTVGAPFVLAVEVSGAQSLDGEPELPDLPFAQFLGSNTQASMRVVNGRRSVAVTAQYRFQALREGTFEIPGFTVPAGGRMLRTEPLDLTVTAQGAAPGPAQAGAGVGSDDLFITTEISKDRVRQGEPFVLEYRIWTRVDVSAFDFTRVPEPEGFWVEDVTPEGQPAVEQRVRNDQQYATAVIRRVALVPTGPGPKTIEAIVLEAQVRTRRDDPFDRFFGGRSLFGGGTESMGVVSEPVTISVDPQPPGAPEPFSGMVGSLTLTAVLDRDSVEANEAVTLTVRASGDGNVRAIPEPILELDSDFEVFPPEVSESVRAFGSGLSGEKTFEYVVIPRAPGTRTIPPIRMSYLEDTSGAYVMASTPPLPLEVSGELATGPGALARGGVAELRQDIRFIHLGASLRRAAGPLHRGVAFWILALLPMGAIAGALALRRHRDLLEGDVAYARGRRAGRLARKRLAEAGRLAKAGDARAFYAEVARAVRGLVADKLNLAEAGLQNLEVERTLGAEGVPDATVRALTEYLEECDRRRFAPAGDDPGSRQRLLERASDLMSALDRALR